MADAPKITSALQLLRPGQITREKRWPPAGSLLWRMEAALENRWAIMTAMLLYALTMALAFSQGVFVAIDDHYPGLRRWAIPLGRGAGLTLDVNCALILFPVCKEFIAMLRKSVLAAYLPLDSAVAFHRLVAWLIVVGTVVHGGLQGVNYIFYLELTPGIRGYLQILITGLALTVMLILMVLTSLKNVRRTKHFNTFWNVHRLYWVFYPLLVLHGMRGQEFTFWMYGAVPCFVFVAGRVYRWVSGMVMSGTITVAEAREGNVAHIEMKRPTRFRAGQYFDVKIPAVSWFEWHPYTASSSPLDHHLSFDSKALGDWTDKLYKLAAEGKLVGQSISVRGPFGAPAQHAAQFDHVLLIASGIGATPGVAWLKHLATTRMAGISANATPPPLPGARGAGAGAGAGAGDESGLGMSLLSDYAPSTTAQARRAASAPVGQQVPRGQPASGRRMRMRRRMKSREEAERARRPQSVHETQHWPYSGPCACHPLRLSVRMPSGELKPTHQVLGTSSMAASMQRLLRTATFNTGILWLLITSICVDAFAVMSSAYELWHQVYGPAIHVTSDFMALIAAALILLSPMVDVWCVGMRRAWSGFQHTTRLAQDPRCVRHEVLLVVPVLLILLGLEAAVAHEGFHLIRRHPNLELTLMALGKLCMIVPLVLRFHHTLHRVALVARSDSTEDDIQTVKFVWVNRHLKDASWLIHDLAELEKAAGMCEDSPVPGAGTGAGAGASAGAGAGAGSGAAGAAAGTGTRGARRTGASATGNDDGDDAPAVQRFDEVTGKPVTSAESVEEGRTSHFAEVYTYVTRPSRTLSGRLASEELHAVAQAQDQLRNGVRWGRPEWHRLFDEFARDYPDEDHIGVFFCGSAALARNLHAICVERTRDAHRQIHKGLRWTFRKEIF